MKSRFAATLRTLAVALLAVGPAIGTPLLAGDEEPASTVPELQLSETARVQLQAIYSEKLSRTPAQKKLSTQLVYAVRDLRADPEMIGIPRLHDVRVEQAQVQGALLEVDITADVSDALLEEIRNLGGRIVNSFAQYRAIRASLPLTAVEALAERGDVTRIREASQPFTNKINTTQGDVAHRANLARSTFGVNGAGVRVGVISDSVDALPALQASGDLPAVTVLPGQSGNPGSSEGTAMLEIVHDLAPASQLYFATASGGESNFANNILQLAAAGCKVIVDDVGYPSEHPLQDDIVAQAVNTVSTQGVIYFSSAGNQGNVSSNTSGVWEGDFSPGAVLEGLTSHNFAPGANLDRILSINPSGSGSFFLWWSDANGSSGNDYDLCLVDATGTSVVGCSAEVQDGDDDPLEGFNVNGGAVGGYVLVLKKPSAQARFLHIVNYRGRFGVGTTGQTSGHSAATGAFSVAAVDVATAGGAVFVGGSANPVEPFSSDGPRRIFYDSNGTPFTPGNYLSSGGSLRQKPDIAAADGVATASSPPGGPFNPFYGTSAAAPHAAGIAALMLQAKPGATPAQVRQAFASTSLDIMAPGFDRDSGYGIIDAAEAVEAIAGGGSPGPCTRDSRTACLLSNRFEVRVNFTTASTSGDAQVMSFNGARAESDQSAFYYFFDNANFEMGIKMQDACVAPFNKYWIYVSGLTNQGYTVTVRDSVTGSTKTYSNPLGSYPQTVGDTSALNCQSSPLGADQLPTFSFVPVANLDPHDELADKTRLAAGDNSEADPAAAGRTPFVAVAVPQSLDGFIAPPEPALSEEAPTASNLELQGTGSWQISSGQAHMTVTNVVNSGSTTSGYIGLMLWASAAPFSGGTDGYALGSCAYQGLPAGYYYPTVTCDAPYTPPPAGCYYVSILLLEQDGAVWYLRDWLSDGTPSALNGGSCSSGGGSCARGPSTACLLNGRFEVTVAFQTQSTGGSANVMSFSGQRTESDQSVFFYFFDNANFEMGVKMQDACVPGFDRFWAYVSGLTNQGFVVTIRDTVTGATKVYSNPLGTYPQTVGDTNAFLCQ